MIKLYKFKINEQIPTKQLNELITDSIINDDRYKYKSLENKLIVSYNNKNERYNIVQPCIEMIFNYNNGITEILCSVYLRNISLIISIVIILSLLAILISFFYSNTNNKYQLISSIINLIFIILYNVIVIKNIRSIENDLKKYIKKGIEKYIKINYCTKCNRIEKDYTNGICKICGNKLCTIS